MTANPALEAIAGSHIISNHVNIDAKSARWTVSCSCGWSRSRFNSCAAANQAGMAHQGNLETDSLRALTPTPELVGSGVAE